MAAIIVREKQENARYGLIAGLIGLFLWIAILAGFVSLILLSGDTEMKQLMLVIAPVFTVLMLWGMFDKYQTTKIRRLEFDPTTGEMVYHNFLHRPFHFHRTDITKLSVFTRTKDHIERLRIEVNGRNIEIPLGVTNARWERRVPSYTEKRAGAWEHANELAAYLDVYGIPEIVEMYTAEIPTIRIG